MNSKDAHTHPWLIRCSMLQPSSAIPSKVAPPTNTEQPMDDKAGLLAVAVTSPNSACASGGSGLEKPFRRPLAHSLPHEAPEVPAKRRRLPATFSGSWQNAAVLPGRTSDAASKVASDGAQLPDAASQGASDGAQLPDAASKVASDGAQLPDAATQGASDGAQLPDAASQEALSDQPHVPSPVKKERFKSIKQEPGNAVKAKMKPEVRNKAETAVRTKADAPMKTEPSQAKQPPQPSGQQVAVWNEFAVINKTIL